MFPDTLAGVPLHDAAELHVLEAELADEDLGQGGVLLGVGGLVPHHHLVTTHLHQLRSCKQISVRNKPRDRTFSHLSRQEDLSTPALSQLRPLLGLHGTG